MTGLLTPDNLAARWDCSKQFVYMLSSSGRLRKVKIGNLIRFRMEDIEAFEQANTIEPLEPIMVDM